MTEIVVKPHEGKWAAFLNNKPIVRSNCKGCIVKALSVYTNNSTKYSAILIQDEKGQVEERIEIKQ